MAANLYRVQGLCADVKYLVLGDLQNNVFIISDGEKAMVIDPTCQAKRILAALDGLDLDTIVITHAHDDHMNAAAELREKTGACVVASKIDKRDIENPTPQGPSAGAVPCKVDLAVSQGDVVRVGNMEWKVIETPGHTKGSMCLFMVPQHAPNKGGIPILVAGDTLFAGSIGRTDFVGGSMPDMRASLKKLAALPDDTAVLPGHNGLTTIGSERRRVFAHFAAK